MTGEELIAEGQRLAKPCVYLVDARSPGTDAAAIWGGDGIAALPEGPYKHWLSIDGSIFPDDVGAISGVLSIYTNEDDCETGMVQLDTTASLSTEETDGLVLYARPALSLPPIDAVFKFGSPVVRKWLAANNWLPAEGENVAAYTYNDNFPDKAAVNVYLQAWQAQLPLYTGGAHAVLGGWHIPWPDGDWHDLLEQTLVAWTFADAEPWVEVWRDTSQTYTVLQRIT